MGMKSAGPGKVMGMVSVHTTQIDGADIVTNATAFVLVGKLDEAEKELTRAIER